MVDIYASAKNIDGLAKAFAQAKTDIDDAKSKLASISVLPGDFTAGDDLKSKVDTRKTELTTNLDGMSKAFDAISTKLTAAMNAVKGTEHENDLTAKDIDDIITAASGFLPGLHSNS